MRGLHIAKIDDVLRPKNPEYDNARREKFWGWEKVPERIQLYGIDDVSGTLVLPRGFARRLPGIVCETIDWDDQRGFHDIDTSSWWHAIPKGPHQANAMDAIDNAQQGVVHMPPGSGKTVAVLEGIRRSRQRAIVIVDKTNIADQWRNRCETFLGFRPGLIGDGSWTEHKWITIAMQQTLWSRRTMLPAGWYDLFGFVCLDECHHAAAATYYDTLQRFRAAWRIGVSATPYKTPEMAPFIDAILGETILEAPSDEGVIPKVEFVETGFQFPRLFPTHESRDDGTCGFKTCHRKGKVHHNNYGEMIKSLVNDETRNDIIAGRVARSLLEGRTVLVISKRKMHLERIAVKVKAIVGPAYDSVRMTGDDDTAARNDAILRTEQGNCALFSTIADEALDIPRLDSIHLTYPTRNTETLKQQCGRILRTHPDKVMPPEIIDYSDLVGVLASQREGRKKMYEAQGWALVY